MTFKEWWQKKPYWIKGIIIGGLISLLPILNMISRSWGSFLINIIWLPTTLPTALVTGKLFASQYIGKEGFELILLFPIAICVDMIIGGLLGLIIQKIKK